MIVGSSGAYEDRDSRGGEQSGEFDLDQSMHPGMKPAKDPRFSSTQNERVELEDGREIWLSRAMAVVGIVVCKEESSGKTFVALSKRGPGAPDFHDHLCLCGGYLDWDETLPEAVAREVFEEVDLNLYDLQDAGVCSIPEQPYLVASGSDDARQNVTARFYIEFSAEVLPSLSTENCEPDESIDAVWLELTAENIRSIRMAFNHNDIIEELNETHRWFTPRSEL